MRLHPDLVQAANRTDESAELHRHRWVVGVGVAGLTLETVAIDLDRERLLDVRDAALRGHCVVKAIDIGDGQALRTQIVLYRGRLTGRSAAKRAAYCSGVKPFLVLRRSLVIELLQQSVAACAVAQGHPHRDADDPTGVFRTQVLCLGKIGRHAVGDDGVRERRH